MSTRMHLALGLAALTVTVVLAASYLGLVPDGAQLQRQHRGALAENVAVTVSALLDETLQAIERGTLVRRPNLDSEKTYYSYPSSEMIRRYRLKRKT